MHLQIIAVIVMSVVLAAIFGFVIIGELRRPAQEAPAIHERRQQNRRLYATYPNVPDDEPKAAALLLEQSKIAFDRIAADRSALETRATTLVGLAAAATGASTLLTGGKGFVFTPTLISAAVLAIVALGSLLYVLRQKPNPQPNPASLVLDATVWNQEMAFRMYLSISESYSQGVVFLLREMKKDRVAILIAGIALVGATVMVIVNAAFAGAQPSQPMTCSLQYQGNRPIRVECLQ